VTHLNSHNRLIAVDGIDGSGKTTLVERIYELLLEEIPDVQIIRCALLGPGSISAIVRSAIEQRGQDRSKTTMAVWMASAILETYHLWIKPQLDAGHYVIVDRWIGSYLAYQCYAEGTPIASSLYYHALLKELVQPGLYIWCDPGMDTVEARLAKRSNLSSYDQETEAFKRTVISGYKDYYLDRVNSHKASNSDNDIITNYRYDDQQLDDDAALIQLLVDSDIIT
jgi:dTMP kinase